MIKLFSVALALVASAHAYLVTSPSASHGWVSTGENTVTWQRVDTDATSFDLVLTNVDGSVFARSSQVLESNVNGTMDSLTINVTNIPPGPHYRVNLNAAGTGAGGAIYAQSSEFTVSRPGANATTTSSTTSTTPVNGTSTSISSTPGVTTTTLIETISSTILVPETSTETLNVTTCTSTDFTTTTTTDLSTTTETSTATEFTSYSTTTTVSTTTTSFLNRRARRTALAEWQKDYM